MEEIVVTDLIIEAIKGMQDESIMDVYENSNKVKLMNFYKGYRDFEDGNPYLQLPYTTIIP